MTRPPASVLIGRALQLRCPRCGHDKMFCGMFRMHEKCSHCGLRYEREPGYFLGSIYLNYGLTAMLTAVGYTALRFGLQIDSKWLLYGFAAFCVVFPLFYFRYARALWLAMDCRIDNSLWIGPDAPISGTRHERS